jgi:hypothetical protein
MQPLNPSPVLPQEAHSNNEPSSKIRQVLYQGMEMDINEIPKDELKRALKTDLSLDDLAQIIASNLKRIRIKYEVPITDRLPSEDLSLETPSSYAQGSLEKPAWLKNIVQIFLGRLWDELYYEKPYKEIDKQFQGVY